MVAHGRVDEIVGDARVTIVDSEDWAAAFDAVEAAGLSAALVGRTLRVPGAAPDTVRAALSGVEGQVREAPATLEERFLELSRTAG